WIGSSIVTRADRPMSRCRHPETAKFEKHDAGWCRWPLVRLWTMQKMVYRMRHHHTAETRDFKPESGMQHGPEQGPGERTMKYQTQFIEARNAVVLTERVNA